MMAERRIPYAAAAICLTMNYFAARIAQLGKSDPVDELHDVLQCRLYDSFTAADHGETQYRALPKILVTALADGNIEVIRYPRLDAFDDAALALE
jgi:hypothetical protein